MSPSTTPANAAAAEAVAADVRAPPTAPGVQADVADEAQVLAMSKQLDTGGVLSGW